MKNLMLRSTLFLLTVFFSISLNAQDISDSLWMAENYEKREVYITMRDGVRLFTSIYEPKDRKEKHPILLTRTPYSSAPYGAAFRDFYKGHMNWYVRRNYILVIQDVRGRYMSEGNFMNVRPFLPVKNKKTDIDEASDSYDSIDWLVKNCKYNNGNVGVYGGSYPGFYTLLAGLSNHPAIKAINPQAPVTDWFIGDDMHHNGAFFLADAYAFFVGRDKPRPGPVKDIDMTIPYKGKDNYQFFLQYGALKNITASLGDSIAFWNDLMAHPNMDQWWKDRNILQHLKNMKPPTLVTGSPFDAENCYGAWETYKHLKQNSPGTQLKLIMGPWYHMQWCRAPGESLHRLQFGTNTSDWYARNMEYPFFDHYLRGVGKEPQTKEAAIFFTGDNEWKQFDQWPPAPVRGTQYFFQPDGKFNLLHPPASGGFTQYTSDPAKPVPYTEDVHLTRTYGYMVDDQRFAARRPDVLVFQTEPLIEDLTLAGPIEANLVVSTTGTDADFIVKVIDQFPDDFSYGPDAPSPHSRVPSATYPMAGYQMLVRSEVMRGKYRNSFEKPEPFVPGQIEKVVIKLPDVAHTFKKGHRLMVQVQSSWFPLVDRNPQQFLNIYTCSDQDFIKSDIRLYHNNSNPSWLSLPVLKP